MNYIPYRRYTLYTNYIHIYKAFAWQKLDIFIDFCLSEKLMFDYCVIKISIAIVNDLII